MGEFGFELSAWAFKMQPFDQGVILFGVTVSPPKK